MIKTMLKIAVALAIAFAVWGVGYAQGQLADFRIVIEASAGGAKLECLKGCSWTTSSFTCSATERACKGEVDQAGVGALNRK